MQQNFPKTRSVNFDGCTLSDAVGTLHRQGATGRLIAHYPKTPGAFYFKNGRLLDAQIGTVVGFQAVHLATSLASASFQFEPHVEPPRQTITDSTQDLIFDLLLKSSASETPAAGETHTPTAVSPPREARPAPNEGQGVSNVVPIFSAARMPARPPTGLPAEAVSAPPMLDAISPPVAAETAPAPDVFNLRELFKESPHVAVFRQRRAVLAAGAVAPLAIIAVAVILLTGQAQRADKQTTPDAAGSSVAEAVGENPAAQPTTAPAGIVGEAHASPITLPDGESGWSLSPVEPSPQTRDHRPSPPARKETATTKAEQRVPPVTTPMTTTLADSGARTSGRATSTAPVSSTAGGRTVTVIMQVVNGRVAQASIVNSRPGMEAYEASALRIARGRRFPPGTEGQEKLQIKLDGPKQ